MESNKGFFFVAHVVTCWIFTTSFGILPVFLGRMGSQDLAVSVVSETPMVIVGTSPETDRVVGTPSKWP